MLMNYFNLIISIIIEMMNLVAVFLVASKEH